MRFDDLPRNNNFIMFTTYQINIKEITYRNKLLSKLLYRANANHNNKHLKYTQTIPYSTMDVFICNNHILSSVYVPSLNKFYIEIHFNLV